MSAAAPGRLGDAGGTSPRWRSRNRRIDAESRDQPGPRLDERLRASGPSRSRSTRPSRRVWNCRRVEEGVPGLSSAAPEYRRRITRADESGAENYCSAIILVDRWSVEVLPPGLCVPTQARKWVLVGPLERPPRGEQALSGSGSGHRGLVGSVVSGDSGPDRPVADPYRA